MLVLTKIIVFPIVIVVAMYHVIWVIA